MAETQKHILVVEDDKTLSEALVTALTYEGYKVTLAEDGPQAIKDALALHPDLMLLDLMIPVIDGIGVLREVRKDEWGKDARIIVLTAVDDLEKIAQVVEAGGGEYITKTQISLGEIVRRVRDRLG